ncbi:phosphoglycolate phosphatase [Alteromonas sp. KUL106]|nr:phosphoglycolate phosphatase [Alteromonas sp. KUL106]
MLNLTPHSKSTFAMRDINTFLFDLDGTLVDSVPDLATSLNLTLAELRQSPFTLSEIRNWVGNGARALVHRGLSGSHKVDTTIPESEINDALEIFLRHYTNYACHASELYPNVIHTLRALKQNGFKLALVTNKPKAFIPTILEGFNLDALFDLCIGGDSLEEKKPSPLPLLYICNAFNVSPSQCVMVGDSKNDILAAKAAKMKSIGLTYGYNYGQDISSFHPDWVMDDIGRILDVLSLRQKLT